jgi:hypothetical protein
MRQVGLTPPALVGDDWEKHRHVIAMIRDDVCQVADRMLGLRARADVIAPWVNADDVAYAALAAALVLSGCPSGPLEGAYGLAVRALGFGMQAEPRATDEDALADVASELPPMFPVRRCSGCSKPLSAGSSSRCGVCVDVILANIATVRAIEADRARGSA